MFSNQILLQVINSLTVTSEKTALEMSNSEMLEIKIKDSPRSDIAGVNIPVHLLIQSKYWVPLFPSSKIETLSSLPKDVPLPRVLLQVSDSKPQGDEFFGSICEQHADPFESFASEIVMASLLESPGIDTEELFGRNDIQTKCKKQSVVIKILSKQLETTNDKLTQMQHKIESVETKLAKTTETLAVNIENANEREKYLLEIIQSKDSEIHQTLSSNMTLQGKLRFVENDKEHLSDQVRRMEMEIERLRELETELEIANSKINKSESIQDQLNKTLLKLSKSIYEGDEPGSKSQMVLKDQEIQMLKNISEEVKKSADMQISSLSSEITELKSMLITSQEHEKCLAMKLGTLESDKQLIEKEKIQPSRSLNLIDENFADAMKKLNLGCAYSKLKDFTYQVKGKVVSLALCRGGLFARVGSSLVNLEEFLDDILEKSENTLLRNDSSFVAKTDRSIENISDAHTISKNSSLKTFLKSTQSSLNKLKPVVDKIPFRDRNRVRSTDRRPFK